MPNQTFFALAATELNDADATLRENARLRIKTSAKAYTYFAVRGVTGAHNPDWFVLALSRLGKTPKDPVKESIDIVGTDRRVRKTEDEAAQDVPKAKAKPKGRKSRSGNPDADLSAVRWQIADIMTHAGMDRFGRDRGSVAVIIGLATLRYKLDIAQTLDVVKRFGFTRTTKGSVARRRAELKVYGPCYRALARRGLV